MQEIQEMWVPSLGQEYPLEKEMATHSSITAWENSMGRVALAGHSPKGCEELDVTEHAGKLFSKPNSDF